MVTFFSVLTELPLTLNVILFKVIKINKILRPSYNRHTGKFVQFLWHIPLTKTFAAQVSAQKTLERVQTKYSQHARPLLNQHDSPRHYPKTNLKNPLRASWCQTPDLLVIPAGHVSAHLTVVLNWWF